MLDPLSIASLSAALGALCAATVPPVAWASRHFLRRARRLNREGRCGGCGRYLPFTADPDALFVIAGIYACARCARRGRRWLTVAAVTVPPVLIALGGVTIVAIVNSGLPLSWWMGDRLVAALLPSFGAALGIGLTLRAAKRANRDPAVPAYENVAEALDTERRRRENWALPGA